MSGETAKDGRQYSTGAVIAICVTAVLMLILIVTGCVFGQKVFRRIYNTHQHKAELKDAVIIMPTGYYSRFVLDEHINEAVSYDIIYEFEFNDVYMYNDNLDFGARYVTLKGDQIPHLDKINRKLREHADEFVETLKKEAEKNPDEEYRGISAARVIYNDEQRISIVIENEQSGQYQYVFYFINVDLVQGKILDSTDMIRVDGEFVRDFRRKGIEQNGEDFPDLTDEQIFGYLTDENTLLVFYTPEGLEVGIIYLISDGYASWISVTYEFDQEG